MTAPFPVQMSGFDRTFLPPRSVRRQLTASGRDNPLLMRAAEGRATAWDLFELEQCDEVKDWATSTLTSLVAAIDTEAADALGCTECEDTGFYGVADPDNPDLLTGLVRRQGEAGYQALATSGAWDDWDPLGVPLEVLDLDLAGDLAAAVTGGAYGLLRRYYWPRAFLPPEAVVAATPLRDVLMSPPREEPPNESHAEWVNFYAVVDEVDHGAVLDLVRVGSAGDSELVERWDENRWSPDPDLASRADLPVVPLTELRVEAIQAVTAANLPSLDPRAERLRRYWTTGKGAIKIRWNTPGDWTRCYRHLRKYMGVRAKGYCALRHKRATGTWPGSRFNIGRRGSAEITSPEESLLASLHPGRWTGDERIDMTAAVETLTDGIYSEVEEENDHLLRTLTAGGFPVKPPDEWYANPNLTEPTPLVIEDNGRVYGHIAQFGTTHIGMAGGVQVPHSPSNYQYFNTGALITASGKQVNVGQLTLAGGHASLYDSPAKAVKHYDDTNSAVADVTAGEDRYGVWVAGSLRPDITPEQVRAFRASSISGDWRVLGGAHELVAACAVNVPGFPIARARVASGSVLALVAAGARPLMERRAAMTADAALLERITALEARLPATVETLPVLDAQVGEIVVEEVPPVVVPDDASEIVASTALAEAPAAVEEPPAATPAEPVADAPPAEPPAEEEEPPELTPEQLAEAEKIAAARAEVASIKRDLLRRRVHSEITAGVPPQFRKEASTIKGTDSFPIKDVASLKDAIQAYGRAKDKPAAQKHIISMAYKLKRPDLIPANWKK